MSALGAVAVAAAYGTASALVPVVNAEAYAVVAGARAHSGVAALVVVVALAAGQTLGKLVLFEAARRGSARWTTRFARRGEGRAARWAARIRDGLSCRRTGLPLVLVSASLGLPPLAAVSLAAGASSQRWWEFAAACLVGRVARFGVLVLPAALALA